MQHKKERKKKKKEKTSFGGSTSKSREICIYLACEMCWFYLTRPSDIIILPGLARSWWITGWTQEEKGHCPILSSVKREGIQDSLGRRANGKRSKTERNAESVWRTKERDMERNGRISDKKERKKERKKENTVNKRRRSWKWVWKRKRGIKKIGRRRRGGEGMDERRKVKRDENRKNLKERRKKT